MKRVIIFILAAPVFLFPVCALELSWINPTEYENGTPFTTHAFTEVRFWNVGEQLQAVHQEPVPSQGFSVSLAPGTYEMVAITVTTTGERSAESNRIVWHQRECDIGPIAAGSEVTWLLALHGTERDGETFTAVGGETCEDMIKSLDYTEEHFSIARWLYVAIKEENVWRFQRHTPTGPACSADFNGDRLVNYMDFPVMKNSFRQYCGPFACAADLNADGVVNFLDFAIFRDSFLKVCDIGEGQEPINSNKSGASGLSVRVTDISGRR